MKTLLLARHGEAERTGVLLGQTNPPLSERGLEQARALASDWTDLGVERLIASKLQRSQDTAKVVGYRLLLEIEADYRLNELSYGLWDGKPWADIEDSYPETAKRKLLDWWGVTPEGGEAAYDFYARVEAAWRFLVAAPESTIGVVGHTAVNAVIVDLARRKNQPGGGDAPDWDLIQRFEQEPGAFLRLGVASS